MRWQVCLLLQSCAASPHTRVPPPSLRPPLRLPLRLSSASVHTLVGRSAKAAVSCAAAWAVVRHEHWQPVYYIAGALLNGLVCKALKNALRQPRPPDSPRRGYGMPSSHACSLFFFSAALLANARSRPDLVSPQVAAAAAAYSLVASSWRVRTRLHSLSQTLAGALLGAALGLLVAAAESVALRPLARPPSLAARLLFGLLCTCAVFSKEAAALFALVGSKPDKVLA